ncbi:DUF58 domain-containing protein [Lysinibacillus sp. 54212]|uniref:DUF58 domain-containing protein n=1 Tax=Lysinibacillus sp. 54212 TaxID=3119829 RepID=UPI002FC8D3DE
MTKPALLLQDDWQIKLRRFSLSSRSKLRGQHKGSHRSQRFGTTMDFSDFREYHPGDDVRQVDWNVFARTDKYFIKRFLDEQEMRVHVLLDASKSMAQPEKWRFACQLSLALGLTVLQNDDRFSFSVVAGDKTPPFRKKGAIYRQALTQHISTLPIPSLKDSFAKYALQALPKGQTMLVIITDGLEQMSEWEMVISKLPRFAKDIRIITIGTEQEMNPSFSGDIELQDIERDNKLNVSMTSRVIEQYMEKKQAHEKAFESLCSKYGIATMQLVVDEGFQHAFFNKLRKANWIQ